MQGSASGLKVALIVAVCLTVLSASWGFKELQSLRALRHERDALSAATKAQAATRLDGEKRECALLAEQQFRRMGYSEDLEHSKTIRTVTFTDHYSNQYSRCLMELSITDVQGGHQTDMRQILDVNERKLFGDYLWISSDTKKYWEQKPFQCRMSKPGEDEAFCNSTEQWETFEKQMMTS